MKKSLVLCALALGLSINAFAYENAAGGYSVKEGTPMFVYETQDTFAYSNYSAKSFETIKGEKNLQTYTAIRFLTKKEMSDAVGTDFSTDYFTKELEKLTQNKNEVNLSELSKLADSKIYFNNDKNLQKLLYGEDFDQAKLIAENTKINVKKVGKGKSLEFSNYFIADGSKMGMKTAVFSANDCVYTVITLGLDVDYDSFNAENADAKTKKKVQASDLKCLKEEDFDADKVKKLTSDHTKTLKSFKTFAPETKQHVFGYTDSVTKKFVKLPQEWFYLSGNFVEDAAKGNFTFAGNGDELVDGLSAVEAYREEYRKKNNNANLTDAAYEDCMKLFLKNFNGGKASLSMTLNDSSFKEMFGKPLETKLMVDQIIRGSLKRADQFCGPNVKLNDYDYSTSFTETEGKIDINTLVTLYKAFLFRADLKGDFNAKSNVGNITFDARKISANNEGISVVSDPAKITLKNTNIQ